MSLSCKFASLLLALYPAIVAGVLYTDVSDVPDLDAYDFLVVGGVFEYFDKTFLVLTTVAAGPGGSTIANRLTEDVNISVLLLEAGGPCVPISLPCAHMTVG